MANVEITFTPQEQNYNEILLQAVAVIDNARTALAKQVTTIATVPIGVLANCCTIVNLKAGMVAAS